MRQSSEPYHRVIGGMPHLFPDVRIICRPIRCVQLAAEALLETNDYLPTKFWGYERLFGPSGVARETQLSTQEHENTLK